MSFSFTSLIPGVGHEYAHVATAAIVSGGLIAAGLAGKAAIVKNGQLVVEPAGKFSIKGLFELATEFIRGIVDMVIGEHGRKYVPFFTAIFVFVFVNNIVGVLPGVVPATENLNTSFAMGIFIFLVFNFLGIKENGAAYIKHLLGPRINVPNAFFNFVVLILFNVIFMFVIETISVLVRPVSLGLRLANVMMGDHTVVGIFTGLVPFLVPIPFYLLGMFVCFVQAFVFTLLSMVYISLATAHDH